MQVDGQDAAGRQRREAVVIKALRAQLGGLALMVKAVDQQGVENARVRRHKRRAVAFDHLETRVVFGHLEVTAQGNHVRVDLHHRDAGMPAIGGNKTWPDEPPPSPTMAMRAGAGLNSRKPIIVRV
jgi:hypothetical protein